MFVANFPSVKKRILGFRPVAHGLALALATSLGATPVDTVRQLAQRVIPGLADQLDFEVIPDDQGFDVFEVDGRGGRIVLRGNNGVAPASTLNRYLEVFCRCEISWNCGDQIAIPRPAPAVAGKVCVVSPHRWRYAYNFCTHGYTMAWWDWSRWEHELDFLAVKGVNLALIIEGQEEVWIRALMQFGYAEPDARAWLCQPSHQPWQQMGNIEGYGARMSPEQVAQCLTLGQRIVARMRVLGMTPVLPGSYGMVPADFRSRFPDAKVHTQGTWGGMKRPDPLDPLDPVFAKFAQAYYGAQRELSGPVAFFAADPFHEGGDLAGIDLAASGRAIQAGMVADHPDATWVLQAWQENPRPALLDALDRSHVLVLDLFYENEENWRTRDQFGNSPWLWCTIQNFGGNTGLSSHLDLLRRRPAEALREAGAGRGVTRGIGALSEGSETGPLVWEIFFRNAWHADAPDPDSWLREYCRRRYGNDSAPALQAQRILLETVFGPRADGAPLNSVVCARPSLEAYPKACEWGTTQAGYDTTRVPEAWRRLLAAAADCGDSDGYCYDVVDVGRQVLADLAGRYHRAILHAYESKDADQLHQLREKLLGLFRDLDELLATRKEFLLGVSLADARRAGATAEAQDRCERCARELITTWDDGDTITDYANRQWAGLVGTFYRKRWQTWLDALDDALKRGEPIDVPAVRSRIRDADLAWTRRHDRYATQPTGDVIAIAQRLFDQYAADAMNSTLGDEPSSAAATTARSP